MRDRVYQEIMREIQKEEAHLEETGLSLDALKRLSAFHEKAVRRLLGEERELMVLALEKAAKKGLPLALGEGLYRHLKALERIAWQRGSFGTNEGAALYAMGEVRTYQMGQAWILASFLRDKPSLLDEVERLMDASLNDINNVGIHLKSSILALEAWLKEKGHVLSPSGGGGL